MTEPKTLRLLANGYRAGKNDVLVSIVDHPTTIVFYLPGDIQNFEAEMTEWQTYSLEHTLNKLKRKFGGTKEMYIVVRAERTVASMSEFDHFLRPGMCMMHTLCLINSVCQQVSSITGIELNQEDIPIILCGFSKGSLVLNAFVAEYATLLRFKRLSALQEPAPEYILDWQLDNCGSPAFKYPPYEPTLKLLLSKTPLSVLTDNSDVLLEFGSRIQQIHWLDAHRFPTNPAVVEELGRRLKTQQLKICLHGTPRQLNDPMRVYIRQEHDTFVEKLKNEAPQAEGDGFLINKMYFENERRSLAQHFRVLDVF